jgi:PIN domain nuclease of toxin-antitoxin system
MKLLLDTHTFIWWASNPEQLPKSTLELLKHRENQLWVSLVCIWEIQIKYQLGKLDVRLPLAEVVAQQQANGIILLSMTLEHILELEQLPMHHRDPFDRLLIAQSRVEKAVLVSRDRVFQQYDCQVIWN